MHKSNDDDGMMTLVAVHTRRGSVLVSHCRNSYQARMYFEHTSYIPRICQVIVLTGIKIVHLVSGTRHVQTQTSGCGVRMTDGAYDVPDSCCSCARHYIPTYDFDILPDDAAAMRRRVAYVAIVELKTAASM